MTEQANILDAIRTIVQEEVRPFKNGLENEISGFRNEMNNRMDAVMGELKTIRQEQIVSNYRVDNHENRITNIEDQISTKSAKI